MSSSDLGKYLLSLKSSISLKSSGRRMNLWAWISLCVFGGFVYFLYTLQKLKTKEQLMKAAIKITGFKDFGFDKNPKWLEGFELAVSESAKNAKLKPIGRVWTNYLLILRLCERLKFVNYVKNHPELEKIEIKNPIFMIGLPRTGSTLGFNLFALDNDVKTLQLWEFWHPTPSPSDPEKEEHRLRRLKFLLGFQTLWSPELDKMHYIRAHHPEEDNFWFLHNNFLPYFAFGIHTPKFTEWFLSQEDKTGDKAVGIYEDFRNMLRMRMVGKGKNPSRWLFKGVLHHQHVLPALFRVFPDARIIYLKRDPVEAVGSWASLETALGAHYQNLDPKDYGKQRLNLFVSLEASLQKYRQSLPPEFEKKRFVELLYSECVKNPYESVKKAYTQLGLEFTEEFASKMKKYLDENPKDKRGKHHYNLKTFGLTDEMVREAFAPIYGDTTITSTSSTH